MDKKTAIEHFASPSEWKTLPFAMPDSVAAVLRERVEAGQFLAHYVRELESSLERLTAERDAAIAQRKDVPRTITLTYMPSQPYPEVMDERDHFDSGSHWTVSEGGRHMGLLDPRECQALVACMLLGAPHPPLSSLYEVQNEGARRERHRQERTGRSILMEASTHADSER